jgi:mannose-1-phosphate guanylyltransferase
MPEKIEEHFGDGRKHGVHLRYVFEQTPLGTAGAIRNAIEHIDGMIYACNGDILTKLDLVHLREWHAQRGAIATIHTRPVDDPSHFGVVETDADGRVRRFVEKPKPGETDASNINAGTYVLEPEAIEEIPAGRPVSIERETFPHLIERTGRVFALSTNDYWIDVGRPDSYMQAHIDILDGRFSWPVGEQVAQGVWRADSGTDLGGVEVRGPAYFGRDVRIERSAVIGPYAAVYDGCRIGAGAIVERSILWPGCNIQPRARVSGAILGLNISVNEGQHIAPGSVLAEANGTCEHRMFAGLFAPR